MCSYIIDDNSTEQHGTKVNQHSTARWKPFHGHECKDIRHLLTDNAKQNQSFTLVFTGLCPSRLVQAQRTAVQNTQSLRNREVTERAQHMFSAPPPLRLHNYSLGSKVKGKHRAHARTLIVRCKTCFPSNTERGIDIKLPFLHLTL